MVIYKSSFLDEFTIVVTDSRLDLPFLKVFTYEHPILLPGHRCVGRVSRILAFPAGILCGSRAGMPHFRLPTHLYLSAAHGLSRRI